MKYLAFLFLFYSYLASAQSEAIPAYSFAIKTSPLNILDPWNGTLVNLGAELRFTGRLGLYSEYGQYFPEFNVFDDISHNKGFLLKEELKFYSKNLREYFSVEFCYSEQEYLRNDTIDLTNHGGNRYARNYRISRCFPGIVFQYGTSVLKWEKLVLDFYVGIGMRYNIVKCALTDEEAENRELGDWNNANTYIQKNGNHLIPKFNCGFRIGYKVK